jgi:hypothetical protein
MLGAYSHDPYHNSPVVLRRRSHLGASRLDLHDFEAYSMNLLKAANIRKIIRIGIVMRVPYKYRDSHTNELRMRNERPWAVGFGKEYISIAGISYMYSIEREALVEPRIRLMSSELYRDRHDIAFYAARSLRFLADPFVKWILPWLPESDPWTPRRLPSTTVGESSNRARSCA